MVSQDQYDALRSGAGLVNRGSRGRLLLKGADRRSYLQGLLTNDIEALAPGTGCYAALLTPQGRMISDMRVLELGDAILLDLPGSTAVDVRDRLVQFIFSEDVEVTDVCETLLQFGLYGPQSAAVLAAAIARLHAPDEPVPSATDLEGDGPFTSTRWDIGLSPLIAARNDDYGPAGFDLFPEAGRADALQAALIEAGAVQVADEALDAVRIERGVPAFGADMTEDTIPLEAGIEGRAISFSKGCYVGQEIVIRVLHRGGGRVARRLVGFSFASDSLLPAPGDRVRVGDQDAGWLTSVTWSPALGRPIALGYAHRDHVEPGTTVTIERDGRGIDAEISPLPFTPPAAGLG
jgi:folate-binding protein YgfZ